MVPTVGGSAEDGQGARPLDGSLEGPDAGLVQVMFSVPWWNYDDLLDDLVGADEVDDDPRCSG